MTATLAQAPGTAASAAASPTSIAPSLTNPSKAGNSLLLVVVATGTPTITTPAGWTAIQNNVAPAGLAVGLFTLQGLQNNGLQSVTVTITATAGGAVAVLIEFNGTPTLTLDVSGTQSATSNSYGNIALAATSQINELLFYVCGFAAATLTPSNSADFSGAIGTAVSTNGTPNAQVACFFENTQKGVTPTIGGSLSASVVNQQDIARFSIAGSVVPTIGVNGASFVGQSLNPPGIAAGATATQPIVVGTAPQPIGQGNFFSGTTGSF